MRPKPDKTSFKLPLTPLVVVIVLLGVLVHFSGYSLISSFFNPLQDIPEKEAFVQFPMPDGGVRDALMMEQALLFDSAPLFLPTEWNYLSNQDLRGYSDPVLDPLFESFEPALAIQSMDYDELGSLSEISIRSEADFLSPQNWSFFEEMGRDSVPLPRLSERSGYLEVIQLPSGSIITGEEVTLPESDFSAVSGDWRPIHFLLLIDRTGRVGEPLLSRNSTNDEVDSIWKDWLTGMPVIRRLSPGYYRVEIGP